MTRPTTSFEPPGGKGMMRRTGRAGYVCAIADAARRPATIPAAKTMAVFMSSNMHRGGLQGQPPFDTDAEDTDRAAGRGLGRDPGRHPLADLARRARRTRQG